MSIIIDLVLLLIVALCIWNGYKSGLIGGFAGSAWWFAAGYYKWLHLTFVAFFTAAVLLVVVSWLTSPPPERVQKMVDELKAGN